jgi:catechol 2,3-dioxygenase-like lactoylglutathione lyase family enzyme
MVFKKLGMVILMEHDLEAAVAFYTKLGLELNFHLEGQWAEFSLGTVKIGLCPTANSEGLRRTGLVVEVDNLKELYEKLKTEGVEFLNEPLEKVHGIMVSFKDPGDNVIDLYQPTPEKVRDLVIKTKGEEEDDGCCGSEQGCCEPDA